MSADEAFIMQRRDGEVMLSFFKALVSDPPPAQPRESSLDDAAGIADRLDIFRHKLILPHQATMLASVAGRAFTILCSA